MIHEGLKLDAEETGKPSRLSFFKVALTAIGTSIDSLAVGVGLAFVDVNIWLAAALIGLATTTMVTIGVMLGRAMGSVLGKKAEIFGGVTLIGVGAWILAGHL